jgi:hypothetical protein
MSTILEMAEAIRSEGMSQTKDAKPSARSIGVDARNSSEDLYDLFAARSWRLSLHERTLVPSRQQSSTVKQ